MSANSGSSSELASFRPLLWVAGGVCVLWLSTGVLVFAIFPEWPERGQFGDMFGAVNSLFSGLAFAGVIFTIYLQRQELALQRKELELTRTQLARSADAQEKSEQALTRQVDALERTARLNALNSVIGHYKVKIDQERIASKQLDLQKQQLEYVKQLEQELQSMSSF